VRLDPATGKTKLLQKDARIGDLVFNRTDKTILGIRHMNGICTLVRIKAPYTAWEQVYSWPYGTTPYDLDVAPAGDRIVASFGHIEGKQEVQLLDLAGLANGDATPVAAVRLRAISRTTSRSRPTGSLFGSSSHWASRTSSVTRSRQSRSRPCRTPTAASCGRSPRRRPAGRVPLHRTRVHPATIDATALKDIAPITFLGERLSEERPIVKTWNVGSPLAIPYDEMKKDVEPYWCCARSGPSRSIRCCRATRTRSRSAAA
jgi:hypothetical protein